MAHLTSLPEGRLRILAADSSSMNTQLLVEGLSRNKRFHVIECPSDPAEILALVRREHPHVALISAKLGDNLYGFQVTSHIRAHAPRTCTIMLLDSSERSAVVQAFRVGARGIFCRTESIKSLGKCIQCVQGGQVWANSNELHFLLEALAEPAALRFVSAKGDALLSGRELDVVRCVAEGLSNREIAQRLHLTEHTIKNYLFRIFNKLGVSSRVEVVLHALNQASTPQPLPLASSRKETAALRVTSRTDPSLRADLG
jgi:DNA-binding NarL/FixJ family response regulator